MKNSEYLRYALAGKRDIIHKLQDDIRKLEMDKEQLREEKKDIIIKNHKLVKMATYYKERSEEQEELHNNIVASFEKEIAIYEKREKRRSNTLEKPKKMSLRDKLQRNTERNKRKNLEDRCSKFINLPKV